MKKLVLMIVIVSMTLAVNAQKYNDMMHLGRYAEANHEVIASKKIVDVVFIGNSITDGWVNQEPSFFTKYRFEGRGISGQTTPQMLSRFRSDVVALKPKIVVINGGINDIAENSGTYDESFTFGNIVSMVEITRANNIKVVLTSLLPASSIGWRPEMENVAQKVDALNALIKGYAVKNKIQYVDYNAVMRDKEGGLPEKYSDDGIHPNPEGYAVMEKEVLKMLRKVLPAESFK